MKRVMAMVLTLISLFALGGWSSGESSGKEDAFSLIKYLDAHEIQSLEEFQEIIEENTDYSVPEYYSDEISYFEINIDYDNNLVCVTTLGVPSNRTDTSNSASKDYYSDIGALIFSINVSGNFRYSYYSCTVLSKSGRYYRPSYSTWTSTPTVGSGNFNATEAYVEISGTAVSGGSSYHYSLILICDNSGNFSTY